MSTIGHPSTDNSSKPPLTGVLSFDRDGTQRDHPENPTAHRQNSALAMWRGRMSQYCPKT